MGMYDSLFVKCGHCNCDIEFQTKNGECKLHKYTTETIPLYLLESMDNQTEDCPWCGKRSIIHIQRLIEAHIEVIDK